jgi:hypothetical protein
MLEGSTAIACLIPVRSFVAQINRNNKVLFLPTSRLMMNTRCMYLLNLQREQANHTAKAYLHKQTGVS